MQKILEKPVKVGDTYEFSEQTRKYIINKYTTQQKASLSALAREFKVDSSVIKRLLTEENIPIKNNHALYSLKIQEDFFEQIDTEAKAYIFGFFCADGYIDINNKFGFKLGYKDENLLETIKQEMQFEGNINHHQFSSDFTNNKVIHAITMIVKNKKLCDSLRRKGITEDKTHELLFPKQTIPEELCHHFVRGYFDGNGSAFPVVSKREDKTYLSIGASICGRYEFLKELGILINITKRDGAIPLYPHKMIHSLQYSGKTKCIKFYEYLYKDATFFLKRKKKVFEDSLGKFL